MNNNDTIAPNVQASHKKGSNQVPEAIEDRSAGDIEANARPTTTISDNPKILSLTKQVFITITLALTTVLTSSGAQVLFIALPTIEKDLKVNEGELQWIVVSYNLAVGCLLLVSGRIADIYGRKKLLIAGMVILTIFNFIGGFMKNGSALIVTRALAGCGVALTTPSTTGIIAELFEGKARSRVFTIYAAGYSLGGILGLVIGGLFVSYVRHTWRSALFFITGLGLLGTIMAIFIIPSDGTHTKDKHVDWPGAILSTVGLVFFSFAISGAQSAPEGWKTDYILALLVIGVFLIIAFFFWEHHVATKTPHSPMMRLALWTRAKGRLAVLYLTGFLAMMGFIPALYNSTLFFQNVQSTGTVGAMLRFLPTEISGVICTILVILLIHRVPAYQLLVLGLLATGFGNMCFALSEENTNYWKLPFHGMWLIVFGCDLYQPTGLIFVSKFSYSDEYSVAGGLFQTMLRLGNSVGLALSSIMFNSIYQQNLHKGLEDKIAYLKGLQASFWLSAGGCWFGVFIASFALKSLGTVGKDQEDKEKENDKAQNPVQNQNQEENIKSRAEE
ncbi:uncharacterized protein L201_005054 [Kwoniella dendrophila CBS 6074]|uniref:Major facilitator superfamily (MFS) profile domain-containing protein n=1 Tax=Kwoniella dendrophila CBS 6074 TaxID=1295534 RepID=A0AAX4JXH9_9TREE